MILKQRKKYFKSPKFVCDLFVLKIVYSYNKNSFKKKLAFWIQWFVKFPADLNVSKTSVKADISNQSYKTYMHMYNLSQVDIFLN